MSVHRDTKKVPASNLKLKKLVDWKIFELQSVLVSDDVDTESVDESLLWFQPRHFSEVLEERVNDDKCGYPLCPNPLDDKNNASYRINYAEKKIYSIELSKNYCCVDCIEKAQLLEKRFDDSVPYSRSVTKTLDLTAPVQSNIEEVLNVLASASKQGESKSYALTTELPPPPMYSSSILSDRGALEVQFVDGLPVPAIAGVAASVGEQVDTDLEQSNRKAQSGNLPPSAAAKTGADSHSSTAMDQESVDLELPNTPSAAGSALHREVFHNRASFSEATTSMASLSLEESTREQVLGHNSGVSGGVSVARNNTSVSTSTSSNTSASAAPTMAEMFATMNALREKHKLTNPSTLPTTHSTRFTDGSLLEKTPTPVKKDVIAPVAASTAVRTGTMGRRPGPRNIRWGADSSTAIDSTAPVDAMQKVVQQEPVQEKVEVMRGGKDDDKGADLSASAATSSPSVEEKVAVSAPAPILKNVASSGVPVVKEKPPAPSGVKRSASQLSGLVVERVNPKPLSVAAMMRKRENEGDFVQENTRGGGLTRTMLGSASSGAILQRTPAPSTLAHINNAGRSAAASAGESAGLGMYDRDEVDRGDDEGENWVDVDPQELLALGYSHSTGSAAGPDAADSAAMAMSIEGYIANVKKNIRVSPATTIKNLSHSPYIYEDINHRVNAANANASAVGDDTMSISEGDGGDEGTEEMDPTSDNEADFAAAAEGGGEGDEPWESEEEEDQHGTNATVEPPPGQSLFLTVWATMDELFGASLDTVFQDPSSGSGSSSKPEMAVIPPAAPVVQEDDYNPPVEMSRPPIALEQQNAQHAFVKLLQRGIQTAESQLNLHSMCLTLQEERSLYGLIKHKLLSTANNTLQRRNNMSSSLGSSNAGTGLHSAGWTLIGLLVIDAVVTKKQIGPLRRKQSAHTSAPTAGSEALVTRDVAAEAWNSLIERTATEVLTVAVNRKNSQVNKLRDGDIQILRSYFDYI